MPSAKAAESTTPEWVEVQPFTTPINLEIGQEVVGLYQGANEVEVPDTNATEVADSENHAGPGRRLNLLHEFLEPGATEPFGIWGSAGLNKRMADVRQGALCRIRYEGKVDLSGGRTARQYRVWTDNSQAF